MNSWVGTFTSVQVCEDVAKDSLSFCIRLQRLYDNYYDNQQHYLLFYTTIKTINVIFVVVIFFTTLMHSSLIVVLASHLNNINITSWTLINTGQINKSRCHSGCGVLPRVIIFVHSLITLTLFSLVIVFVAYICRANCTNMQA